MKESIKPSVRQQTQQQQKGKIPWLFGLEVKDLVHPVTIRRMHILYTGIALLVIGGIGYALWDNYLRQPTGVELVGQMISASGGMGAWNAIKQGQFKRTKNLYNEAGELLETKTETFYFKKTNEGLKLQVHTFTNDGEDVWIGKDKDGYWASQNQKSVDPVLTARGLGMMCDSKWCEPLCATSMAFYRFSMPFKLTDYGVLPELAGTATLDGKDAQVLDVTYIPEVGKDRWVFYSYPEDHLIRKLEYHNKSDKGDSRPEEIYWSDYRTEYGINFSHKWTRYWSNGKVMDEYIYSDVDFQSALADDFFKRPEGEEWLTANE